MTSELRSGGLIQLRLRMSSALAWMPSILGALCGVIASGGFAWDLADGVRLLLILLLVETGWGTLWQAVAFMDWRPFFRLWREWDGDDTQLALPYFKTGSPGYRLTRWVSRLRSWGTRALFPKAGPVIGTATLGLIFSLVLSATLGLNLVALTVCLFSLVQIALLLDRGRGQPAAVWDGLLRLGLPWLAGHIAFAPLTLTSCGLAVVFSLVISSAQSSNKRRGRALWMIGQLVVIGLFIFLQRSLAVPFLAFLLIPQHLFPSQPDIADRWSRQAWPWLATSMLLAAWAL